MKNFEDIRLSLHRKLCDILGSNNVYFQPPETVKLKYPAIIYSRNTIDKVNADNIGYLKNHCFDIILIYKDPDSNLADKLCDLEYCRHDRHYVYDRLYHDKFTVYYDKIN